jgi:mRNA degradation ribonuclease J1/J2
MGMKGKEPSMFWPEHHTNGIPSVFPLHLEDRSPITLGPFTITPYLVDHSAYDAYAILVEADGVGLFYTGDFRAHGRKGKLFYKLLRLPPKHVDVLLMEGTTLGRPSTDVGFPSEADLERRFVDLFVFGPQIRPEHLIDRFAKPLCSGTLLTQWT